jgi:hypothetical protein
MAHYTPEILDMSAFPIAAPFAGKPGRHRLAGVVKVNGTPAQKRIAVTDRYTHFVYAQVLSQPNDGSWEVYGLPELPERSLLIVAFDDTGEFNAEVADFVSQVESEF